MSIHFRIKLSQQPGSGKECPRNASASVSLLQNGRARSTNGNCSARQKKTISAMTPDTFPNNRALSVHEAREQPPCGHHQNVLRATTTVIAMAGNTVQIAATVPSVWAPGLCATNFCLRFMAGDQPRPKAAGCMPKFDPGPPRTF